MAKTAGSSSLLVRGLTLMQVVAAASREVSVAELMAELDLPKPTVHRIAAQLEEEGYLQRNPRNKRYSVGPNLQDFAMGVMTNQSVGASRHAILEALSKEVGETCNCTILDGSNTVYFDRVEANWPIKIQLRPGSRLPLHATASGKLFLAYMKPQERKRLLRAAPLSRNTERTIVCPDLLEEQLQQVREEGIGYDNEELLTGMVAIAVPVFDRANKVCFTVAIHAPTIRKQIDDLRRYIPSLRRAASALAANYCTTDADDTAA